MNIKEILQEILHELKARGQLNENRLWTVEDVAKYWQVHPNVARLILAKPGTPKSIGITKHARYDPEDIKNYRPSNR